MAFTKKTWQCEETITADELNRMEDGIEEALECCGGGSTTHEPLIIEVNTFLSTWKVNGDVSWQSIHDAYVGGRTVLFREVVPGVPGTPLQSKDRFGSVVNVIGDDESSRYYVDVFVQGKLRRFDTDDPSETVSYRAVS